MRNRSLLRAIGTTAVVWGPCDQPPLVTGFVSPAPSPPPPAVRRHGRAAAASAAPAPSTADASAVDPLESDVIAAIRSVAAAAPHIRQSPKEFFATLGGFGKSSGALIADQWLTPAALEECTLFWDDGFRVLMRDLFRSYIFSKESTRYRGGDWAALGWFVLLASGSSLIFLPLLLPLIHVALEDVGDEGIAESAYVPPSFGPARLAAMRRLRRPSERPLLLVDGTPRNVREGVAFFRDGTLLLARDVQRGQLVSRPEDTWGSYAWFAFLSFSSFPLTPLVLPLIDRRRDGATSDYVPSSYRPERLKALARLRERESSRFGTAIDILRAAAEEDGARPPPEEVLRAALEAQREGGGTNKAPLLEALAGAPGRRWELAYLAGKPAVLAARQRRGGRGDGADDGDGADSWYRPLERLLLPWTRLRDGVYVDNGLVSAVQNFDAGTMQNVNGVYRILDGDLLQTTVAGPFSWDGDGRGGTEAERDARVSGRRGAGVCAFRPTVATFKLGPFRFEQDLPEELPFDQTHIRDLPFFKFVHVDDRVAVAVGRSGGLALWTRMAE